MGSESALQVVGMEGNLETRQRGKRDFILCVFLHISCRTQKLKKCSSFCPGRGQVNWKPSLARDGAVSHPSPSLCFSGGEHLGPWGARSWVSGGLMGAWWGDFAGNGARAAPGLHTPTAHQVWHCWPLTYFRGDGVPSDGCRCFGLMGLAWGGNCFSLFFCALSRVFQQRPLL